MNKLIIMMFAAVLILPGCNKSETSSDGTGRLSVKITDGPFNIDQVESAMVTITKIELRKSGDESGNPFTVISEIPVTADLINLRNGITEELANIEIQAGDYDLVRLYVDEAGLKMKGEAEPFSLKVPSGEQTGIKVFISPLLHVEGGITTELLLDFDLARSFVMRGNMDQGQGFNGFIFKPCIRAANNSIAGRIEGFASTVSNDPIDGARILAIHGTDTVSTSTEAAGHYALIGLPGGTYSMLAIKESFDTIKVEDVVVVPANKVIQNFILIPSIP